MPLPQELLIWSESLRTDGVTGRQQRRSLSPTEFNNGVLYGQTLSTQQLNQILYLLTVHANPSPAVPVLFPDTAAIPDVALEMNGQAISPTYEILSEVYGANLPDITGDAPTGFTYIVRKA